MDNAIWRLQQRSRELREQRVDVRAVWDDAASQAINSRYLTPHEEDSVRMENALGRQHQEIDAACEAMAKAEEQAQRAREFAHKVGQGLQLTHEERMHANAALEKYAHYKAGCAALLPKIYGKIEQANSTC